MVREHLLKNMFGFEYLIAPYTIAHLKLSQYLQEQGHPLQEDERLQVFLTNTLEPVDPQKQLLLPAVTAEVEAAQRVKDRNILVITGNPPYSGNSKNKGDWITRAIDGYKFTIETDFEGSEFRKPLGERNSKWLNDDYVKFIRFAQLKMDAAPEGIVGIITNHSWLDNPTFRGMRQSLMRTYEQIYVLDLHGSSKPKEFAPDGSANENVFDIQKGVAITLFVKRPGLERGVWYSEVWGTRLDKYRAAASSTFRGVDWQPVEPIAPYYMFRPMDWTLWPSYSEGWSLSDSLNPEGERQQVFSVNVLGFQTHRDDFAVSFDRDEMVSRIDALRDTAKGDLQIRERYGLKDSQDWQLRTAREAVQTDPDPYRKIVECAYRPFDARSSFFGVELMDRPRKELLDHLVGRDNLVLLASRQTASSDWRHAFVSSSPPNDCVVSDASSEANYAFMAYLALEGGRRENLSPDFRAFIDTRYDHHYSPEEIIGYIYAILHSPTYRRRYAGFLQIDFPRILFAETQTGFDAISALGWSLVEAHLLRKFPRRKLAGFHGKGNQTLNWVRYAEADGTIAVNDKKRFGPVPKEVWEFRIGGHQVLDKYLKSRKGRVLTLDEINHVSAVADSLAFTIEQMARIDAAYIEAFADRDN